MATNFSSMEPEVSNSTLTPFYTYQPTTEEAPTATLLNLTTGLPSLTTTLQGLTTPTPCKPPLAMSQAEYYASLFAWFCYSMSGKWYPRQPLRLLVLAMAIIQVAAGYFLKQQEVAPSLFVTSGEECLH